MKNICCILLFFLLGCNHFIKSTPQKINFQKFSNSWDSLTSQSLDKYSKFNNELTAKAKFINESLKGSENKIDILDRKPFLSVLKEKTISTREIDSNLVIVELNQSGEKNIYQKYIIINSDSCFKMGRNVEGIWGILSKSKISKESTIYISKVETDTTGNDLWGKGINDICIITKVYLDSSTVSPILFLKKKDFDELINRLNP